MSTAHRPTWDPAQAREVKGGSRQFSTRDMASHTKLKFRQPGQTSVSDVAKRDLRAELLLAEQEARNKKRKAQGLPPLALEEKASVQEDEEVNKRRKLLQDALTLDADDSDESDAEEEKKEEDVKEEDDETDSDEDEDDTAELLRELEKIKRERAAEQAKMDAAANAAREAEIATGNPLLNLAAALGQSPGIDTTAPGTFAVKRRWDDDLIFKNQAMSSRDKPQGQFVNDLLRTEFHKKFMSKFIK